MSWSRPPSPRPAVSVLLGAVVALVVVSGLLAPASVAATTARGFSDQLRLAVNRGDRPAAAQMATAPAVNELFALRSAHWRFGAVGTCRLRPNRSGYECPVAMTRTTNNARRTAVFVVRGRSAPFKVVDVR